jgi:hypothetical protein
LHFASGALEVESLALEGPGAARLKLRLPGARSGEIALALPSVARLVRAHVAFDEALDVRIQLGGVVDPSEISDR